MLGFLAALSFVALILGRHWPRLVLPARFRSRENVEKVYGALFVVFALGGVLVGLPPFCSELRRARPTSPPRVTRDVPQEFKDDRIASEGDSGQYYLFVDGYMVTVGMPADLCFELLGPDDVISQTVVDDPGIENSLVVTKLYGVGSGRLELEFRREEHDGPYVVSRIVVHHW